MDRFKCPSFFKCREKEVGVWKLLEVYRDTERKQWGGEGKKSQFLFFVVVPYSTYFFLFNSSQVCLPCSHKFEVKKQLLCWCLGDLGAPHPVPWEHLQNSVLSVSLHCTHTL